jgi:hypothetical protein
MLAEAVAVSVASADAVGEGVLAGSVDVPVPTAVLEDVAVPDAVGVGSVPLHATAATASRAAAMVAATRRADRGRIGVLMNFYGRARAAMRHRAACGRDVSIRGESC